MRDNSRSSYAAHLAICDGCKRRDAALAAQAIRRDAPLSSLSARMRRAVRAVLVTRLGSLSGLFL